MLCKLLCSIQVTLCVLVQSPTAGEASAKDSMSVDSDDRLWSRQPGSMAGNGLDETYRKFAAARRKYMLLYFQLLQSTGRLDVLLAGHTFLQSTAWGSPAMMVDLARWDHCTQPLAAPFQAWLVCLWSPACVILNAVEHLQSPGKSIYRCLLLRHLSKGM